MLIYFPNILWETYCASQIGRISLPNGLWLTITYAQDQWEVLAQHPKASPVMFYSPEFVDKYLIKMSNVGED